MANPIFQDFPKKTSDSEVTKSIKSWQLEERYNMESDYNNGRSADFSHFSSTSNHIVGGRPRYSGVNAFMDPTFNACITPRSLELDPTILRYSRPLSSALEAVFLTPTTDPGHQLIHPRRHPRSSSSTILSAIENLETPPSRLPLGYKETPTPAPVKIVQGEDVLVMDGILVDSLSSAGGDRSIVRSSLSSDSSSGSSIGSNTLYKTEMCRSWEETGTCRYGSKCQFAHGKEELRPYVRNLKLKPESQGQICKSFAVTGTCTFGSKCRYTHSVTMTRATLNTEAEQMVASTLGLGSMPEDVAAAHAYINQALYGPSQRRRLPAFLDICPE